MARIIVGSYMVRYPLGGMLSWSVQWLLGFQKLGHDVYFVEKSNYPNACYDPTKRTISDDCSYGVAAVSALLGRFGMQERWCFVDATGHYRGLSRQSIEEIFRTADLFVDIGSHGAWVSEAADSKMRVLVEGEPGYNQMKMEARLAAGEELPQYDHYFTNGANVGTDKCTAPTAGKQWRPLYNPVVVDLFDCPPAPADAPFTTVMNWQSHKPLKFNDVVYGQKDVEFLKFMNLPRLAAVPLEVAVSGKAPSQQLVAAGWRVRQAQEVTESFESYRNYIAGSKGEFSVCKNGYVSMNTGWFSDRSAAYLASGRPVIMQETGFSEHLPCGEGLLAVRTVEEAAAAIREVCHDYARHSKRAREIATEHLEATKVLGKFLRELGIS